MKIILIRHAQSKGNEAGVVQGQTDEGLSELGKTQAKLFATYLEGEFSAIYSSDLERAIQTAEPIAKKLNLQITTDSNLREAHFGIWEGLTYEEVKTKYQEQFIIKS